MTTTQSWERPGVIEGAGWIATAGLSWVLVEPTSRPLLGLIAVGILLFVWLEQSLATLLQQLVSSQIDRGRQLRVAGVALRLVSIGAIVGALLELGVPLLSQWLESDASGPLVVLVVFGAVRVAGGAASGLLSAHGRDHVLTAGVRSAEATRIVAAFILLIGDPSVMSVIIAVLLAELIRFGVGLAALHTVHAPEGWDVHIAPRDFAARMAMVAAAWLPVAFAAELIFRRSTTSPKPLGVISMLVELTLFVALVAIGDSARRAPTNPLTTTIIGTALVLLCGVTIEMDVTSFVVISIVALGGPMLARNTLRDNDALPVAREANGEMSIIVTYSEATESILPTLLEINTLAAQTWGRPEVITLSLGASEATVTRIGGLAWSDLRHVQAGAGQRGDALRHAILLARGEHIAVLDLDLQPNPQILAHYADLLEQFDLDAVVGCRLHARSPVGQSRVRRVLSRAYRGWCSFTVYRGIGDPRSGAKLFRRSMLLEVIPFSSARGDDVDLELLGLLRRRRAVIAEAAVLRAPSSPVPTIGVAISRLLSAMWLGFRIRLQIGNL